MRVDSLRRVWLTIAGISGAMAVGFAALAAHGVAAGSQAANWLETGSRFQIYHALGLVAVAQLFRGAGILAPLAGGFFCLGTVLFCGGLYAKALLGVVTAASVPIGGGAFVLGWLVFAIAGFVERQ